MNTPHKCPICDGTGLVSRPPGVAGDQMTGDDNSTSPYDCGPCKGTGVLWEEEKTQPTSFTDGPRVGGCRADRIPFGDLHFYEEEGE